MKCPRDGGLLEAKIYESNIEVDVCPTCRGIFLDKGELEAIQETIEQDHKDSLAKPEDFVGGAYEMSTKDEPISCPKCESHTMESREYAYASQVVIDACPDGCGIWLDPGELQALEQYFERNKAEAEKSSQGLWQRLVSAIRGDAN